MIVSLQNAYKYHRTNEVETAALSGIDLNIHAGEFVAVMGPSGSGKSTLLNLIGLIDNLSMGSYHFIGQDTTGLSRKAKGRLRKGNMGFVFQSFNLIDELTAAENVELPLTYLKAPARERRERVRKALSDLDMLHRKDHRPQQLSGGQQQRIAIARAIVTKPALLLADEPTGNLDSVNSRIVMEKLRYINREATTIVMATHSKEDAAYAGRRIELFDGMIILSEKEYLTNKNKKSWPIKHS